MAVYPAVVVLIVCKVVFAGTPTDNDGYTGHRETDWDLSQGAMHCKRLAVDLYDPAVDQGAAPQPFNPSACMVTAMKLGPQFDVDNVNKPWRFYRAACPVPIMDDHGTPNDPRDDSIAGYKIPECPTQALGGKIECEQDSVI